MQCGREKTCISQQRTVDWATIVPSEFLCSKPTKKNADMGHNLPSPIAHSGAPTWRPTKQDETKIVFVANISKDIQQGVVSMYRPETYGKINYCHCFKNSWRRICNKQPNDWSTRCWNHGEWEEWIWGRWWLEKVWAQWGEVCVCVCFMLIPFQVNRKPYRLPNLIMLGCHRLFLSPLFQMGWFHPPLYSLHLCICIALLTLPPPSISNFCL